MASYAQLLSRYARPEYVYTIRQNTPRQPHKQRQRLLLPAVVERCAPARATRGDDGISGCGGLRRPEEAYGIRPRQPRQPRSVQLPLAARLRHGGMLMPLCRGGALRREPQVVRGSRWRCAHAQPRMRAPVMKHSGESMGLAAAH